MVSLSNGSLAASAIAHLCNGGKTIPLSRGGPSDLRAQFEGLMAWAGTCNRLLEYSPPPNAKTTFGTEHDVFFHETEGRVFKKTRGTAYGSIRTSKGTHRTATPYFYLQRMEWNNEVFDSDLKLECIVPDPNSAIVISQPFAEAADPLKPLPRTEEIITFMTKMGFQSVKNNPEEWYREADSCSACDAKAENFIKTAEGVRPIDLIVSKNLGFNPHTL